MKQQKNIFKKIIFWEIKILDIIYKDKYTASEQKYGLTILRKYFLFLIHKK